MVDGEDSSSYYTPTSVEPIKERQQTLSSRQLRALSQHLRWEWLAFRQGTKLPVVLEALGSACVREAQEHLQGPLGAVTCGGITACARDRGPRGKGGPRGLRHEPGLGGRDLGKRRGETWTHVRRAEQKQAGDGGHSEEWFEREPKDAWSANKESWLTELVASGRCGLPL